MTAITNRVGTNKGFVGCVEQVIVNGYKYDMRKAELVGDSQFGVNVGMYRSKLNCCLKNPEIWAFHVEKIQISPQTLGPSFCSKKFF